MTTLAFCTRQNGTDLFEQHFLFTGTYFLHSLKHLQTKNTLNNSTQRYTARLSSGALEWCLSQCSSFLLLLLQQRQTDQVTIDHARIGDPETHTPHWVFTYVKLTTARHTETVRVYTVKRFALCNGQMRFVPRSRGKCSIYPPAAHTMLVWWSQRFFKPHRSSVFQAVQSLARNCHVLCQFKIKKAAVFHVFFSNSSTMKQDA